MEHIPNKREHIVHVYRRDAPHGIERAVCGWLPPGTWHPKSDPVPLDALPDCERCPRCLARIAGEPRHLYALMPPEDWTNWEDAVTSEPDPSGDPATTGYRGSTASEVLARRSAESKGFWSQARLWVLAGIILLVVAVAVVALLGGDNSSSTPSSTGAAKSAGSAGEAASKQPRAESNPARSAGTGGLPLRNGGWQLDSVTVASNRNGAFEGKANITYAAGSPKGEDYSVTVTLIKGDKAVAALRGNVGGVTRDNSAIVQLTSSDPWVAGPYTYDFRTDHG